MKVGRRTRQALTWLLLVVLLAVGVWVLYPRRTEVLAALEELDPVLVVLSLVLTTIGVALTAQVWLTWLSSLSRPMPWWTIHRLYYVTQSAKYIPGGLWPIAAQAAVSRRLGVPVSAMVAASSLTMLTQVVTGAAVGLALLGATSSQAVAVTSQLLALAGLALLTPPGIRLSVAVAHRLRLPVRVPVPTWGAVARAVGLMLLAWLAFGGAMLGLARAGGGADVGLLTATGVFATGWTVGFLALPVPAGVGVREGVIVTALAGPLGSAAAIAVAVVSRVLFTVVDLVLALVSVGVMGKVAGSDAGAGADGVADADDPARTRRDRT